MQRKIIKLTKEETNELLKIIREEEPNYGLILTLQYIYGRNVSEVYNLKKTDVDQDNNTITFIMNNDELVYPVHEEIKTQLYDTVNNAKRVNVFQEGTRPLSNVKDGINYYLHKKTEALNELKFLEGIRLTTKDFKALRGQHLYQDGVSFKTIHELFHNTNTEGTKRTICYSELKKLFDKEDINDIIHSTCLNVFTEHEFNDNPVFYVTMDEEEALIELNSDDTINFYGEDTFKKAVNSIDYSLLIKSLRNVKVPGDYTCHDNIKFLRN